MYCNTDLKRHHERIGGNLTMTYLKSLSISKLRLRCAYCVHSAVVSTMSQHQLLFLNIKFFFLLFFFSKSLNNKWKMLPQIFFFFHLVSFYCANRVDVDAWNLELARCLILKSGQLEPSWNAWFLSQTCASFEYPTIW